MPDRRNVMILTVDIGNTNTVLSVYTTEKELIFSSRFATDSTITDDQMAILFKSAADINKVDLSHVRGAIISSVVPPLMTACKGAIKRLTGISPFVVGPGIKTGLNIKIDDTSIAGADLVCAAVGALEKYKPPMIIFDLGTATTITAIDNSGAFIGGAIMPGIKISLDALSRRTAQLPHINTELKSDMIIGTNTIDCMKTGIILGSASMIEGMIKRFKRVLGEDAAVIATGGLSTSVVEHCEENIIVDRDLVSEGALAIYFKNK